MVGLKSSSTIHRNLEVLKEEGKISWNPSMPRTIVFKEIKPLSKSRGSISLGVTKC